MSQLIECQKEIRQENLWLEKLPELLKFPNGLLNDTFPVFVTQFVSLLQSHGIDKEIQPINSRVAHLKCLVGSRLLCDSFLSWIACKINRENHEAFCIQYLEGFIGGTWNEGLKNNFLKTFGNTTNVKSIVLLLNVGRYVGKRENYKTFIGEYYDENGAISICCHYSFFVYFIDANESFYCDSLGWEKPPDLEKNARDLTYLLLDIKPYFVINECHVTHSSNRQAPINKCIKSKCVPLCPLQRFVMFAV